MLMGHPNKSLISMHEKWIFFIYNHGCGSPVSLNADVGIGVVVLLSSIHRKTDT